MFDGIDCVLLPASNIDALLDLYVDCMGFSIIREDTSLDPQLQGLWDLPVAPTRAVTVGKPNSNGGWIRLVEAPGLPQAEPAGRPDRTGPYALDFYLKDPDVTEEKIIASGWEFRSPATFYNLPGTDLPVRERMLEQPVSGLVHAFVKYRPRGTRCVIDTDENETVSEVAAVVVMTERFEEAKEFGVGVLGAQKYFEGLFDDPAVAEMLNLESGEGFPIALFRGPKSRNARLEFGDPIPGGSREPDEVPRVILSCGIDDLDTLSERLKSGSYGQASQIVEVEDLGTTRKVLSLHSVFGVAFEFFQR